MAVRSYSLDPSSLDYIQRTNGHNRIISADSIKMDVNRFARGVSGELREIAVRLINGQIDGQQWYNESARVMKYSYRAAVDVARGSNDEMSEQEKELWLALAILLFLLLNKTAEALEDELISIELEAGKLRSIMSLRGGAISGLFENWRLRQQARKAGYTEAKRVLGVAEHCEHSADRPGCVELAARGWVPIWQMVPIGGATCRDNCKCRIRYRGKVAPIGG